MSGAGQAVSAALLDTLRCKGDPPLDRLVDASAASHDLHALLNTLKNVRRLTPERMQSWQSEGLLSEDILAFLTSSERLPDWVDEELFREGGQFYRENGIQALLMLACASLPACYCWAGVAQVLDYTRRLERDAPRRLPETAQMVMDVEANRQFDASDPGNMLAVQAAQKVRLMHALIRHMIRRHEAVDGNAHDHDSLAQAMAEARWQNGEEAPISQELLLATLLTFHFAVLRGLQRLGLRISAREQRAYLHRWNVIGAYLGIDHVLLAGLNTMDEAATLFDLIMARNRRKTDAGPRLEAALLGYMRNNLIRRVTGGRWHPVQHVPAIVTFHVSDAATYQTLSLKPNVTERLLAPPVLGFLKFANFLARVPALRWPSRLFFRWVAANSWQLRSLSADAAKRETMREPGEVRVPESLAKTWGL